MEKRRPFQGVKNIVRFNWHFYAILLAAVALIFIFAEYLFAHLPFWQRQLVTAAVLAGLFFQLAVTTYVYDLSGLYDLWWLRELRPQEIVTINAGFDETSQQLIEMFPSAAVRSFDFYDPQRHTEISIERARKLCPSSAPVQISTGNIPLGDASADLVLIFMAAHEIRIQSERELFFKEVRRVIGGRGKAVVVEHLKDAVNTLAYSVGVSHFYSRKNWLTVFTAAGFTAVKEEKLNLFITAFTLSNNGKSY